MNLTTRCPECGHTFIPVAQVLAAGPARRRRGRPKGRHWYSGGHAGLLAIVARAAQNLVLARETLTLRNVARKLGQGETTVASALRDEKLSWAAIKADALRYRRFPDGKQG